MGRRILFVEDRMRGRNVTEIAYAFHAAVAAAMVEALTSSGRCRRGIRRRLSKPVIARDACSSPWNAVVA
jgi:hypothetical protein